MAMPKVSLPLFYFMIMSLALLFSSNAQDTNQDYINSHNDARVAVGAGLGNMTWNETVADYARDYANQRIADCNLVHSDGPYGENLAWGSGDLSGLDAVRMWVDEKAFYDYNSNTCTGGQQCGHYTQVVWRDSISLGCAKVTCNNGLGTLITCNYYPPGNVIGQRPY
ncbi:pathogenesis-related protein 1 [Ricinus communis]|uniref:STS14 protein, putative n=1 Tax=Ricinus communis TaxID=3988 RepID=B9S7V0_RICCO|nr:pathogenesis-related protein 1 [Ricinus communis]EEF40266.1 STS14 protein precursor, putative [Ricinus communis]|eukprot:XP_002522066.1 pathogenesis-related protein 1 [Ricinus communis]